MQFHKQSRNTTTEEKFDEGLFIQHNHKEHQHQHHHPVNSKSNLPSHNHILPKVNVQKQQQPIINKQDVVKPSSSSSSSNTHHKKDVKVKDHSSSKVMHKSHNSSSSMMKKKASSHQKKKHTKKLSTRQVKKNQILDSLFKSSSKDQKMINKWNNVLHQIKSLRAMVAKEAKMTAKMNYKYYKDFDHNDLTNFTTCIRNQKTKSRVINYDDDDNNVMKNTTLSTRNDKPLYYSRRSSNFFLNKFDEVKNLIVINNKTTSSQDNTTLQQDIMDYCDTIINEHYHPVKSWAWKQLFKNNLISQMYADGTLHLSRFFTTDRCSMARDFAIAARIIRSRTNVNNDNNNNNMMMNNNNKSLSSTLLNNNTNQYGLIDGKNIPQLVDSLNCYTQSKPRSGPVSAINRTLRLVGTPRRDTTRGHSAKLFSRQYNHTKPDDDELEMESIMERQFAREERHRIAQLLNENRLWEKSHKQSPSLNKSMMMKQQAPISTNHNDIIMNMKRGSESLASVFSTQREHLIARYRPIHLSTHIPNSKLSNNPESNVGFRKVCSFNNFKPKSWGYSRVLKPSRRVGTPQRWLFYYSSPTNDVCTIPITNTTIKLVQSMESAKAKYIASYNAKLYVSKHYNSQAAAAAANPKDKNNNNTKKQNPLQVAGKGHPGEKLILTARQQQRLALKKKASYVFTPVRRNILSILSHYHQEDQQQHPTSKTSGNHHHLSPQYDPSQPQNVFNHPYNGSHYSLQHHDSNVGRHFQFNPFKTRAMLHDGAKTLFTANDANLFHNNSSNNNNKKVKMNNNKKQSVQQQQQHKKSVSPSSTTPKKVQFKDAVTIIPHNAKMINITPSTINKNNHNSDKKVKTSSIMITPSAMSSKKPTQQQQQQMSSLPLTTATTTSKSNNKRRRRSNNKKKQQNHHQHNDMDDDHHNDGMVKKSTIPIEQSVGFYTPSSLLAFKMGHVDHQQQQQPKQQQQTKQQQSKQQQPKQQKELTSNVVITPAKLPTRPTSSRPLSATTSSSTTPTANNHKDSKVLQQQQQTINNIQQKTGIILKPALDNNYRDSSQLDEMEYAQRGR